MEIDKIDSENLKLKTIDFENKKPKKQNYNSIVFTTSVE